MLASWQKQNRSALRIWMDFSTIGNVILLFELYNLLIDRNILLLLFLIQEKYTWAFK